ncbi:hypothetical protein [Microbacterium sp. cf046]|uniref:hypothetical protein n=1 Tax=Microbacterium sp. cf046 TaxID=1761803 RepID=UPI0011139860|nr:hypothetical protein [Microbacterium sp. cf046]
MTAPRATEVGAQGGIAAAPSWPALAAWGAGLVQLALGAGAITGDGGPAIRMAGILLLVVGAAAIGWGAVALARGRIVVPRAGVAGSLAVILISVAAMALDPTRVSVFAVAASLVLSIATALGCALALRAAARASRTKDAGARRVVGLVVGAFLVAALVTPALAATEAGQHAVPHGEMVEPGHH